MVSLRSLVERIYRSPEAEVFDKIVMHASKCNEAAREFHHAVLSSRKELYEPARESLGKIMRIEEEADAIRRSILDRLAVIGIPPTVRQDYVRLAERVDLIADHVKASARTFLVVGPENIGKELLEVLGDTAAALEEASRLLVEALEKSRKDYNAALSTIKKIEEYEDMGDEYYVHGLTMLRENQDLLLYKLVNDVESAIDAVEDASDVLEEIIVRIIR